MRYQHSIPILRLPMLIIDSQTALKRAEMVSIPYATVPGMDTKSHIYHKAAAIENGQFASSSNKHACTKPPFINGLADSVCRFSPMDRKNP